MLEVRVALQNAVSLSRHRKFQKPDTVDLGAAKRNHPIVIDGWDMGRRFDSCKVGSILAIRLPQISTIIAEGMQAANSNEFGWQRQKGTCSTS